MNEKTVGMLIGKKNVYEYPELSNAVTCMNYVKKETEIPPVLMMHGLADDLVAPEQSIRLYKKLREEDKEVEFYLVENAKHGDPAFWTEKNMDIVEKFLKEYRSDPVARNVNAGEVQGLLAQCYFKMSPPAFEKGMEMLHFKHFRNENV